MPTVKEQARKIADELPDDVTWEQVRYEVYLREEIEAGERDIRAGRAQAHEDVRKRFEVEYRS